MSSSAKKSLGVLSNIQALRALAAFMVVAVHADVLYMSVGIPHFGAAGVDLFFVISGFIMVYVTKDRKITAKRFAVDRTIRIIPMYWVVTLFVYFMALVAPHLFQNTTGNITELVKSLFFIPFLKGGLIRPVLFVGWTLNYEMFFYTLFAIGLLLPYYKWSIIFVVAAIAAFVAFGLIFNFQDPILSFYTSPRLAEFASGMAVGLLYNKVPAFQSRTVKTILLLGMIGFIFGMLALPKVQGAMAFFTFLAAVCLEKSGWKASARPIETLGNASYSLYLTHAFIALGLSKAYLRGGSHVLLAIPLLIAVYAISIFVAVLAYKFLERPMTQYLRHRFGKIGESLRAPAST